MYPISFEPSAFDGSLCSIASDWEAREKLLHSQFDKEKRKEISLPPFFGFFRGPSSRISFPSVLVSQSLSSPFSSAAVGMEADKQNKNEKGRAAAGGRKIFLIFARERRLPSRGEVLPLPYPHFITPYPPFFLLLSFHFTFVMS